MSDSTEATPTAAPSSDEDAVRPPASTYLSLRLSIERGQASWDRFDPSSAFPSPVPAISQRAGGRTRYAVLLTRIWSPGISRDFMPSAGFSRAMKSAVNSGVKRCISSAVQSEGFLPLRTLSSTKRPTIWCAWWKGVPPRARTPRRRI